jgi:hypothetical protein
MLSAAPWARLGAIVAAASLLSSPQADAHAIAGARVFPATLAIDDPGVSDELALPTFTYLPVNGDGSVEYDLNFDYSKRITPNLAISVGDGWTRLKPGAAGWQNIDTELKYQFYVDAPHEFMASVSLESEWGRTGSPDTGDPYTTLTPNLFFGKGFGDLPRSLNALRPIAITGQFGVDLPTQRITGGVRNPNVFDWGFTLQYSLPYRNANVSEVGGPDFLKHLVPLVEAAFQTPIGNAPPGGYVTTGTVQPGVMYMADTYQISLEAVIPVNSASGHGVGAVAELHFFLDDIFPNSIGKPIFP